MDSSNCVIKFIIIISTNIRVFTTIKQAKILILRYISILYCMNTHRFLPVYRITSPKTIIFLCKNIYFEAKIIKQLKSEQTIANLKMLHSKIDSWNRDFPNYYDRLFGNHKPLSLQVIAKQCTVRGGYRKVAFIFPYCFTWLQGLRIYGFQTATRTISCNPDYLVWYSY